MPFVTPLIRPLFLRQALATLRRADDIEQSQRGVLASLLRKARATEWGSRYGFGEAPTYEQYATRVPVVTYEDIHTDIMRMVRGEASVLWPGVVRRYAQSSGTSDGQSKYIPLTDDSLKLNHYRGAQEAVAQYLRLYPGSRVFDGRAFILGGSFANHLSHLDHGVKVGDLSAHLIDRVNRLVEIIRIPSKRVALLPDWAEKLPLLVRTGVKSRSVTNISGVPSWWLTVLQSMLKEVGASSLHDIWPRLEVFFHGGISFAPYRSQYEAITDTSRMHFHETYNASEGFFAVQATHTPGSMLLLPDAGAFFEFIPIDESTGADRSDIAVPAWGVSPHRIYALAISAANGLWRYKIGDTVRIESTSPLSISIAGRTRHFINAFGEEVMVFNTDAALAHACAEVPCRVANYTVAPLFASSGHKGCHQWVIEFVEPPADIHEFEACLDRCLRNENSDYDAKRSHDIFLSQLSIVQAPAGLFDRWLALSGKLGGQRKVPRLSNDRHILDKLLEMMG